MGIVAEGAVVGVAVEEVAKGILILPFLGVGVALGNAAWGVVLEPCVEASSVVVVGEVVWGNPYLLFLLLLGLLHLSSSSILLLSFEGFLSFLLFGLRLFLHHLFVLVA